MFPSCLHGISWCFPADLSHIKVMSDCFPLYRRLSGAVVRCQPNRWLCRGTHVGYVCSCSWSTSDTHSVVCGVCLRVVNPRDGRRYPAGHSRTNFNVLSASEFVFGKWIVRVALLLGCLFVPLLSFLDLLFPQHLLVLMGLTHRLWWGFVLSPVCESVRNCMLDALIL